MRRQRVASIAMAVAFGVSAVTGCTGGGSPDTATASGTAPVIVPGKPGEPARTVPAESMDRSGSPQRTKPNDADIRYVRMMIPHHYQALVLTRLVPERSSSEQVRGLAARINDAQRVEIDAMQAWQKQHGLEVTDPKASYQRQLRHPAHLEAMGMATPEEVAKLEAAQGQEFDVLFLRLMKEHHSGAITMSEKVVADGNAVLLHQMALDIIATQRDEIRRMRDLLNRLTP